MPLRGGDYHTVTYINQLEERLEARIAALEEALASKSGAKRAPAEEQDVAKQPEPAAREEPSRVEADKKSSR